MFKNETIQEHPLFSKLVPNQFHKDTLEKVQQNNFNINNLDDVLLQQYFAFTEHCNFSELFDKLKEEHRYMLYCLQYYLYEEYFEINLTKLEKEMLKQTFEESFDFIRMDEATVKANRKEDLLTIKQESSNSETETSSTTTPPELTKFNAVSLDKTSENRIKYELQPTSFLPNSGSAYNGQIVGVQFYRVFNECNPGLKAHRGRQTDETTSIKITQMKDFVQRPNFNYDNYPMKLYTYQKHINS